MAWEQGAARLRGKGPCRGGGGVTQRGWHPHPVHTHIHIHNVYDASTKEHWQSNVGSWEGGGVRLARLRGEQASNTNQGDLVMDIGLTERALCSVR